MIEVKEMDIPDVLLITYKRFSDERGFFGEIFREKDFQYILPHQKFVQENLSRSSPRTLRGLHYQLNPMAQGKLVYCASGYIYDVAVDIRINSPTYGKYVEVQLGLNEEISEFFYIPPGFAHGFYAFGKPDAHVIYKTTEYYSPEYDRSIVWNDPEIRVAWPSSFPNVSEKDSKAPLLKDAENNFVYSEE